MYNIYIINKNDIILENKIPSKYTNEDMKEISTKAWDYLFQILNDEYNIKITKDDIIYNEYNKPYLKDENIYFNISHSRDIIAIIISDKECGIDIEYIDYKKNLDKLITKTMNIDEIKKYNSIIDKYKFFYKLWTKKEAHFKMLGCGIDFNILTKDINLENVKSYIYKYKKEKYYISFSMKN